MNYKNKALLVLGAYALTFISYLVIYYVAEQHVGSLLTILLGPFKMIYVAPLSNWIPAIALSAVPWAIAIASSNKVVMYAAILVGVLLWIMLGVLGTGMHYV